MRPVGCSRNPIIISLTSFPVLCPLITPHQPPASLCLAPTPGPLHWLSLFLDLSRLSYPHGSFLFIKFCLKCHHLKSHLSTIPNPPQHPPVFMFTVVLWCLYFEHSLPCSYLLFDCLSLSSFTKSGASREESFLSTFPTKQFQHLELYLPCT